jgi:hypothetical protein
VIEQATLLATTLNRFVGMLHAARCAAIIWIRHAEDPVYRIAAKYGLQMTFGTTVLTLRKFQDLAATGQLQKQMPDGAEARIFIEWILRECEEHKTRDAANRLFAHYAPHKTDPPLSNRDIRTLVEAGRWATEEEFVEWTGPIVDRLGLIRDDIMCRYGITTLAEGEEVAR